MRRCTKKLQTLSAVVLILAAVGGLCGAAAASAAGAQLVFRAPTTAPVLDPFRLPNGPYAAGNRGIEYDTRAGDVIAAAADGEVVFAGAVARSLFVTVDHGDGLRSTYGFVAHLLVSQGDQVVVGDEVAVAGGAFHFGTRLHGDYIDPATLFGARSISVRLVPHQERSARVARNSADDRLAAVQWVQAEQAREAGRLVVSRLRALYRNGRIGRSSRLGPLHYSTVQCDPGRCQVDIDGSTTARATPGRLGVRHECSTGKKEHHGSHLDEGAARGRSPLRPPDPPLEPEDEAVHPR